MTLDDLRHAAELLPLGAAVTLPREALLEALADDGTLTSPVPLPVPDNERWISVDEVAKALDVSKRYVYAHKESFPFAKQLPGGTLRFSERGLRRWMDRAR